MRLDSTLPLATLFFKHWAADDREVGVVVALATFVRGPDGQFYAEPSPELRFDDVFSGDVATSALTGEQDIAPAKVGTDLIIHAVARSPQGQPITDWPVIVQIENRLYYEFRVRGPVQWGRTGRGNTWKTGTPVAVNEVPISYALAYGGVERDHAGDMTGCFAENPAGRGYVVKHWLDGRQTPFDAPQIGLLADWMGGDPLTPQAVHGTGPVAKTWAPRRSLAGTFDDAWQRARHPRMPPDYDMGFWNAAPRPLQLVPALAGTETVSIDGVSADGRITIALPHAALGLVAAGEDATSPQVHKRMVLDTVEIDVRDAKPSLHRLRLIWRASVDTPDQFVQGDLTAISPLANEVEK